MEWIRHSVSLLDDTCVPITHDKLLSAVQLGKSTAGKDGITYDILNGLLEFSASQLRPLELIQNEAMRIILGCPRTARIEVLRAELHLPSIMCRIQEITCLIVGAGATVHFTWIPSHVGIPLNEKPDRLAQCALQDDTVDPGIEYTLGYVKISIKDFVLALVISRSFVAIEAVALVFTMHLSPRAVFTPMGDTASHDGVAMRLRLGYEYFREVSASPGVCCTKETHTASLYHGMSSHAKFRPQGQHDLYSLIDHLLHPATLRDIFKEYPQFAPRL
ncbi:hypothetical protein E2C01_054142 [Portunus trituberculatus]|uniref:RNase H type-1 domain-containing protein n=1 Tax=Portunus trituberculatus TaxID=210409 RepID=A0A5B7GRZ9_PORTR|nr:hypothetical protein [Portunus trituberculatus]